MAIRGHISCLSKGHCLCSGKRLVTVLTPFCLSWPFSHPEDCRLEGCPSQPPHEHGQMALPRDLGTAGSHGAGPEVNISQTSLALCFKLLALHFILLCFACVWGAGYTCVKSENCPWESALSFYYIGPRDQTWVVRPHHQCLCLLPVISLAHSACFWPVFILPLDNPAAVHTEGLAG